MARIARAHGLRFMVRLVKGFGDARHFIDDIQRAGLVSLHGQAKTLPGREVLRDVLGQFFQQIERDLQPVALFGVDGEIDVGRRRLVHQAAHTRQQCGENPLTLRVLVA